MKSAKWIYGNLNQLQGGVFFFRHNEYSLLNSMDRSNHKVLSNMNNDEVGDIRDNVLEEVVASFYDDVRAHDDHDVRGVLLPAHLS